MKSTSLAILMLMLLSGSCTFSQERTTVSPGEGRIVIVSPRVGAAIQLRDRNYFGLFPRVTDFRSAFCMQLEDQTFLLVFHFTGQRPDSIVGISYAYVTMLSERIDHWESLQQGEYAMGSSPTDVRYENGSPVHGISSPLSFQPRQTGAGMEYASGAILTKESRRIPARNITIDSGAVRYIDEYSSISEMSLNDVQTITAENGNYLFEGGLIGAGAGLLTGGLYVLILRPLSEDVGRALTYTVSLGLVKYTPPDHPGFLQEVGPAILVGIAVGAIVGAIVPKESAVFSSVPLETPHRQPAYGSSQTWSSAPLVSIRIPLSF